jgi:hypothetical protein
MKNYRLFLIPFVILTLVACSSSGNPGSSGGSVSNPVVSNPVVGNTLTPLPYADNFDKPAGGWKTVNDPALSIRYQDGALHFMVNELDSIAWSIPNGQRFEDFTLDVDATQVDGPDDNGYGVIARYVDDRNFYRFDISGDGYFDVMKFKDGKWIKLQDWQAAAAIHQGTATNHLRLTAKGNQFTLVINDQTAATLTDNDFKQGDIGLAAGTFFDHAGVHVAFDNLIVKAVETQP